MYNPLVSIVIPVYNGSNYLSQAIDSALNQTYKNIEIIVVNDGSDDDGATEKIALGYGDKIRYFRKENGGVSSALNLGIANMKGEWFSWLSHDDMYTPDKIKTQINRLNYEIENNQADVTTSIVIGDTQFINKDCKYIPRHQKYLKKKSYTGLQMLLEVFSGYYISGCTLLINKHLLDNAGEFNTELKYMQDMEMWYRIMLMGCNFYYINEKHVLSRVHPTQTTVTGKRLGEKDAEIVGKWFPAQLINKYAGGKYLLLEYYYLTLLRNVEFTANIIKEELKKENKLIFPVKVKACAMKLYGKFRPLLVLAYYRLIGNIKMKYN
ncbi:MAG: putative glycosyltransferase EpsJ [Firmicutes bacterium ADurb.Bin193]|nr:MAG: putative glycosyltransferase EpsJ [Firmicutes bacterium ADurb.Bin193]